MRCAEPIAPGVPVVEGSRAVRHAVALLLALLASGCSPPPGTATAAAPGGVSSGVSTGSSPASPGAAAASGAVAKAPPRRAARASPDWDDFRRQAAERIVAMNPEGTYGGPVPEPLLAIPVLEISLNGDGSVRRIQVLRRPTQALDTVQLAIAAVERAAPFGSVAHLPRPWRFTETFLFDAQRRFKPRTLDF